MHLRYVEIFCAVASRRSFSKAAELLDVSQSSASQAVLLLEKHLNTQLIDRSKRPLELTPAGRVYFDGCRELLESFRKVEDRVQHLHHRVAGRVRVAAIYSVGLLQMDSYVKRFGGMYPEVELRLDYLHPDDVYAAVLNDEADVGLVSFPRDGGEIKSIEWQRQEMVAAVPPGHALAGRKAAPVHALDGEDFVAFTSELTIRRQVDRWLKQARVQVNIVHEFDNIENIKRAVEIGSGIALLPLATLRRELELNSLAAVRLKGVAWHRPLGIVHRRHKRLSTAAEKFVELLRSEPAADSTAHANGRGNTNGRGHRGARAAVEAPSLAR